VNGRESSEPVNSRKPEMVRGNQRWSEAEDAVERGGGHILHCTPSSNRPYSFLTGLVRSDHCPFFMPCDNERPWLAELLAWVDVDLTWPRGGGVEAWEAKETVLSLVQHRQESCESIDNGSI